MSGVPNGDAQPQAPVAPAPAAAQPEGTPQAPPADDGFVRIPREQVPEGGWHEWDRVYREHQQYVSEGVPHKLQRLSAAGLTLDQVLGWAEAPPEMPPEPPPAVPANPAGMPPQEVKEPLTTEALQKILDERDKKQTEAQREADRQRTLADARKAEEDARGNFLSGLKLEAPTADNRAPRYRIAHGAFTACLNEVKAARIPTYITDDDDFRQRFDEPLTEDDLARVGTLARQDLADLKLEDAAAFAVEQETTTAASLAEGPAGKPPPPDASQMTAEQEFEHITSHMTE